MEFYFSKIVNFFINPLYILFFIILIQIFVIFFINSKKLIFFFSKLFLFLFLFFGYIPLSNFLLQTVEDYIQPSKYPIQELTGIVVLGGSFDENYLVAKERNEVIFNQSAERLIKALEIYKKNPKIIILFSGSSFKKDSQQWSEIDMARKFFIVDHSVRVDNLIFEDQSRNTFENIKNTKNIVINHKGAWGLVTSAYHMPRSFLLFKKNSLITEPIPVDYRTGRSNIFWINFDIYKSLTNWFVLLHEIVGITYYKITNKI